MHWSGSKSDPLTKRWYRIQTTPAGEREILVADQQLALEKGLGEDFQAVFDHFFQRQGQWFQQNQIPYPLLFVPPELCESPITPAPVGTDFDALYLRLEPLEEWVTFLEERLNDCEMAIEWLHAQLERQWAKFQSHESHPQISASLLEDDARRIEKLCLDWDSFSAQLEAEEGRTWSAKRFLMHQTSASALLAKLQEMA